MKKFGIAILGYGTVGRGTVEILEKNRGLIEKRTNATYDIRHILVRNKDKAVSSGAKTELVTSDPDDVFNDDNVNIVVECIGGIEPAKTYILRALRSKCHVVTPNKAVVAANFSLFTETAEEFGVAFRYEASVGGGIPILTSIREALSANNFTAVNGIVNGTTNYILTKMSEDNLSYDEALKQAQDSGFAEADPTADVEGIDCANKLSILIALCFNKIIVPEDIPTEGITNITVDDIKSAKAKGEVIKLISHAELKPDGNVDCWIRPTNLKTDNPLSGISNEFNSVQVTGDMVGDVMLTGKGAGALPTGSAVCGDILAILRERSL